MDSAVSQPVSRAPQGKFMVGLGWPAVNSRAAESRSGDGPNQGGTMASLTAWMADGVGASALSCMKLSLLLLCDARLRSEAQLSVCDEPWVGSYFSFSRL